MFSAATPCPSPRPQSPGRSESSLPTAPGNSTRPSSANDTASDSDTDSSAAAVLPRNALAQPGAVLAPTPVAPRHGLVRVVMGTAAGLGAANVATNARFGMHHPEPMLTAPVLGVLGALLDLDALRSLELGWSRRLALLGAQGVALGGMVAAQLGDTWVQADGSVRRSPALVLAGSSLCTLGVGGVFAALAPRRRASPGTTQPTAPSWPLRLGPHLAASASLVWGWSCGSAGASTNGRALGVLGSLTGLLMQRLAHDQAVRHRPQLHDQSRGHFLRENLAPALGAGLSLAAGYGLGLAVRHGQLPCVPPCLWAAALGLVNLGVGLEARANQARLRAAAV